MGGKVAFSGIVTFYTKMKMEFQKAEGKMKEIKENIGDIKNDSGELDLENKDDFDMMASGFKDAYSNLDAAVIIWCIIGLANDQATEELEKISGDMDKLMSNIPSGDEIKDMSNAIWAKLQEESKHDIQDLKVEADKNNKINNPDAKK